MRISYLPILAVLLIGFPAPKATAAVVKAKPAAKRSLSMPAAKPLAPAELISARAQKVLATLRSRPVRAARIHEVDLKVSASKSEWLNAIYRKEMIETSWAAEMLADKRILAEVLGRELGERAGRFYPRTIGLREFLVKHRLVDAKGVIRVEGDDLEEILHQEFPRGFIVRPAVGVAPKETSLGLFPESESFINELLKPNSVLYQPSHLAFPVRSHILGAVASGEAIVLQENFINASAVHKPMKSRFFQEVRVHTYEGRVVADAIPERWVQTSTLTQDDEHRAEAFVGEFLMSLSMSLLSRQAWGVDVAVMENGELKINDIVTNRGKPIAWSSYLDQPGMIAAYSKHFEEHYGLRFKGFSGALIRHGFANYFPYWKKRIDIAQPGMNKALAYLPPLP